MSGATVTIRGLDELVRELDAISRRYVPAAARETVNKLAFEGRALWQDEMRKALTLRNRFTERRALVDPARTFHMRTMFARLGHTEPYMAWLEEGKPERASKRFRPIPTEVAAGQSPGSLRGGRKRPVRPSAIITRLGNIAVKGAKSRSRKANNARAISGAIRSGRRLALLDFGRGKGIYRVMGRRKKARLVKLYDLSRRTTPVPRTPTLERALARLAPRAVTIAQAALERQVMRARGR